MGSVDLTLGVIGAAALTVALAGCTRQPGSEQIHTDAEQQMPGCRTLGYHPGEGDNDTVYLIVEMRCVGAPRESRLELGYRLSGNEWRLFSNERSTNPM